MTTVTTTLRTGCRRSIRISGATPAPQRRLRIRARNPSTTLVLRAGGSRPPGFRRGRSAQCFRRSRLPAAVFQRRVRHSALSAGRTPGCRRFYRQRQKRLCVDQRTGAVPERYELLQTLRCGARTLRSGHRAVGADAPRKGVARKVCPGIIDELKPYRNEKPNIDRIFVDPCLRSVELHVRERFGLLPPDESSGRNGGSSRPYDNRNPICG